MVAYSKSTTGRLSYLKLQYDQDEIVWHGGLMLAKKNSKKIWYIRSPCNFHDSLNYYVIYESQDLLKSFRKSHEKNLFYLIDEIGYIKVMKLAKNYQTSERERLVLAKDYFVEK